MNHTFHKKILASLLAFALLFSTASVPPAAQNASAEEGGSSGENELRYHPSVIDAVYSDHPFPDMDENLVDPDKTEFLDRSGMFSKDQLDQIRELFTAEMIQIAAYFYPALNRLLTVEQLLEKQSWTKEQVHSRYVNLTDVEKELLRTYTPLVELSVAYSEDPSVLNHLVPSHINLTVIDAVYRDISVTDSVYGNLPGVGKVMLTGGNEAKSQADTYSHEYRENTDDDIDPAYRTSNRKTVDLHLPGRNGLDFSLVRSYNSLNAKITDPTSDNETLSQAEIDACKENITFFTGESDCLGNVPRTSWLSADENFVATGWELNIPTMQRSYRDRLGWFYVPGAFWDPTSPYYLTDFFSRLYGTGIENQKLTFRLDDGATYEFLGTSTIPSNHPYANVTYTKGADNQYFLTVDDQITYEFLMDDLTGKGYIVSKRNRFGDRITYEHLPDKLVVTDTVGRVIEILYDAIQGQSGRKATGFVVRNSANQILYETHYQTLFVPLTAYLRKYKYDAVSGAETYGVEQVNTSYVQLNAVYDATAGQAVETYTYYDPDAVYVHADFNLEDDYRFVYQEPGIFADLDDSNMESGLIVDRDRQTYGEIVYLLLKDVQTDTGLKIHYDYRFYDPGWANETGFVARDARRGTVRMFLDPWVLTYVGYHPVSNVTYTFTDSSGQTKMFTVYVEEDGARAQEIWKAPKKSSGRLILSAGYRSGDSLPTQIIEDYMAFEKRNTFQYGVNELGLVVLTKEYTTDQTPAQTIEMTDGTSRYTFAAHSAQTYTYDGTQSKPSAVYTFDFGAEGDPKPQAVRNFLWRQLLNPPSDIQQYATIHKYTYDHFGFVTEETDERGNVTTYRYDGPYHQISYSKTTSEDQANILETTYSYNADGTLSRMEERYTYKDPSKPDVQKTDTVITEYLAYNAFKRPTRIRLTASGTQFGYWLSQEIRYEYSADGLHVTKETAYVKLHKDEQPTALVTEYEYDARGRLIKQTNPDGSAVEYAYDWKNRQIAETFVPADGSASRTTSITYDDAQRQVTVELPDGERRIYYYSAFGDLEKEIQQIGGNSRTLTENRYNPSGRVLTETLPYGREDRKTQFVYGTNGELWRVVDALNQETVYQYANAVHDTGGNFTYLQQTTRQVDPDGKETWTYEDRFGRVEKVVEKTPTKTRTTYYTYDPHGRVKQQTVQAGSETQTTTYGYDAAGNLIYLRDELGNVYTYAYNSLGQLTAVHINGKLQRSKTYNENGWLLTSSNAEGQTESYRYNAVGLVSEFTDKGGQIHRYTYTPYRELARLSVTKAGSEVYWKDHAYDPDTRLLTGISNSEGEDIAYTYDNWKRLSGQTVAGRTYTFEYDAQDQLSALVYPDGQKVTYTYDPLSRIKTVSYPGMGTVSYTYEVGANVNRYIIDYPNNVSQVRQTDAFDELVSVTHRRNGSANRTETYGYDGFGNIINMTRNGISYNFSYDGLNRIIRETGPSGQTSYRYDDRGNRVSRVTDQLTVPVEGTREYSYNALNQLKTFASSEGTQASYTYYGDGLRATKRVNGNLTRYVYFNGYMIEELGESGNVKARNIWGNELLYRRDFTSGNGGYYLYNGHGDVVAIQNSTGNNLNVYEYDIWGNIVSQTEGMSNPFKYAGEIYDEETGYYYLRARYYDPAIGRFISEDTYEGEVTNPLSLNLYTYVANNPLIYIDPTGHKIVYDAGPVAGSTEKLLEKFSPYYDLDLKLEGYEKIPGTGFLKEQKEELTFEQKLDITLYGLSGFTLGASTEIIVLKEALKIGLKNGINGQIRRDIIINSATQAKKGGETVVGHALQKHAGRNPHIWGKVKGGPDQINKTALKHLEEIIDGPGDFVMVKNDRGIAFLEKKLPDGRGVRLNLDGTFKGFIDR